MSKSNDYIIITEGHNLDDGPIRSSETIHEEQDSASMQALESQGISLIEEEEGTVSDKHLDQFSKELFAEGGIEIMSGDEEGSFL